jgi:hypothetical protein
MNEMDFIVEASCIDWLVKEVEKKLHTSRQGGLV